MLRVGSAAITVGRNVRSRLRVGVIGAGSMGRNHVRIYRTLPDAELVGVADIDGPTRTEVAKAHDTRSFADYRELFPFVDAVSVAVPTVAHHATVLECLRLGLHVLVEKPMAARSEEADEMLREAHARSLVLQVGHVERFNPAVLELPGVISGERILVIEARRLSPPTPRVTDVDVVFDLMIHDVDIVASLVGEPLVVDGALGRPFGDGPLDHVIAHGRSASGTLFRLAASKITQETVRCLEVTTDRSYVVANYQTRELVVHRRAFVSMTGDEGDRYVQEAVILRPHLPSHEPLRLEIAQFVAAALGRSRPITRPEEAVAALRIAERIQALARPGRAAAQLS